MTNRDETARSGANFGHSPAASPQKSPKRRLLPPRNGTAIAEVSPPASSGMASPLTTSDGFENLKFTGEQKVLTLAVKNDANEVRRF